MVYVAQKHNLGCAVASVANKLGISYESALTLFDQPSNAWGRGFYCRDIVSALHKRGINTKVCHRKSINSQLLPFGTIVYVRRCASLPAGHYLIKGEMGWIDSWINISNRFDIKNAKVGIRQKLPSEIQYAVVDVALIQ